MGCVLPLSLPLGFLLSKRGFANFLTSWLVVQANWLPWDLDSESTSIPAALPLPGQQVSGNTGASPQPPRSGNPWPLGGSRSARGHYRHSYWVGSARRTMTVAAPPTFGVTIKNNPLTTTPRRLSGCARSTVLLVPAQLHIPGGHRATASPPLRKCGTALVSGVALGERGVGGLRSCLGGLLGLSFGDLGCAGELISSGKQPSPPWDLGGFRVWVSWDKCPT